MAARRLLIAYISGLGAAMAVWGARMPAVQAAAHLSSGRLAAVLLGAAAGLLAGLQLGGRVAHRYGSAKLLVMPTAALGLALSALGLCRTLPTLIVAAVFFGMAHGLLDIGTNATAVRCQEAYGRPIMSGLHASYSLGALFGAALAAVTAGLPHEALFVGVGMTLALAALASAPAIRIVARLDGDGAIKDHEADSGRPVRTRGPAIWLLSALAAACLLGEGAAADWSAVHLDTLRASAAVSAVAYAVYSAAMAAGRLIGDRLTARYGPAKLVRVGGLIAAVGLGTGLAIGTAPAALLGWTALGLGLSAVVPSLITAAGSGGPRAVAAVAGTGYLGMLIGPAAIGALASVSSLSLALALPVLLAAAVAIGSHRALAPAR